MQKFLRLFLVVALTFSWVVWHAPDAVCASSEERSPIEVPLQTDDGMPSVEVMINGQGPFVFGFDTGAQAGPRIDSSLVEKLKLKATGQIQAIGPSGRNPQASETFRLESVVIGNLKLADVTVASRNYKNRLRREALLHRRTACCWPRPQRQR